MKPYRVLLILSVIFASANLANAQSLSTASLVALPVSGSQAQAPGSACESCWFTQALQQGVTAFQRVRSMCLTQAKAEPACALCPMANPVAGCAVGAVQQAKEPRHFRIEMGTQWAGPGREVRIIQLTDGSATFSEGRGFRIYAAPRGLPSAPPLGCCAEETGTPFLKMVKKMPQSCEQGFHGFQITGPIGISGIEDLIQFCCPTPVQMLQTSKPAAPCCCAKACACCESCKAKPAQVTSVQLPSMQFLFKAPNQIPGAPARICGTAQMVQQQLIRPNFAPSGLIPAAALHSAPARFETPDLEAHCQKITHRGDIVILEGSVLMLIKKHAQPVRVNAERVSVNMKDGSYTVETARQISTSGFGVVQPSSFEFRIDVSNSTFNPNHWANPPRECVPATPGFRDECETPKQRIIQVVPVPTRAGQSVPLPMPPVFPR